MSKVSPHFDPNTYPADRRVHPRQPVRSLAYVELGEGNGGIVLNISEGGMAIQAVMALTRDELPLMRIQLAHSNKPIQVKGRIAWTSDMRKLVGIEFVDLSEESLGLIREWVSLESPAGKIPETDLSPEENVEAADTAETAAPSEAPIAAGTRPRAPMVPSVATPPPFVPSAPVPAAVRAWSSAAPVADAISATAPAVVAPIADVSVDAPPLPTPAKLQGPEPSPDRFGFKAIEQRQSFVTSSSPGISEKWRLASWVGVFAVISLAVGWVAGHASLHGPLQRGPVNSPGENAAAENTSERMLGTSADTSNIEVVDLNNERWLIPIRGSTEGASSAASPDLRTSSHAASSQLARSHGPGVNITEQASASPLSSSSRSSEVSPPAGAADSREGIPPPVGAAVSGDGFQPGHLVRRVEPVYPPDALVKRVEGAIRLYALIDKEGNIKTLQPLSGPPMLVPAAISAVRQWHYSATLLDGHAIETQRQITVTFRLANTPQ